MGAFDAARAAPWQWLATRGCYDPAMRTFGLSFTFLTLLALTGPAAAAERLPEGLVYLRDVDPSIAQDMRYAGFDNFTGRPLPGYGAPECVLRRAVAQALAQVQADLARENLSLKVYDCYRPTRAVRAFMRWAQESEKEPEKAGARAAPTKRFYPALEKRTLFASGYIATHSAHSTGSAVDLTLVKLPTVPAPPYDPAARYGPCTAPAAQRAPDNSLDMGTGFDCFNTRSYTASAAITAEQRRRRATLLLAMRAHDFHNYFREWWHFSFGPRAGPAYDFPIEGRGAQ
jgi:D-alanyl-D-alanine dipeptidase